MKVDFLVASGFDIKDRFGKIVDRFFTGWEDMTGELVNVAPHLPATFAVHRHYFLANVWVVSDLETGSGVVNSNTKRGAIKLAKKMLKNKSEADIERAWMFQPEECRHA